MLAPRKIKYRKPQKGKMRGMSNSGDYVAFGHITESFRMWLDYQPSN